MKKNILRVISLVLAASMIFAFASCTQEIQVRFVDQDGNDIDLESLFAGGNAATPSNSNDVTPSNETPSNSETPSETPSADPATPSETPSENSRCIRNFRRESHKRSHLRHSQHYR